MGGFICGMQREAGVERWMEGGGGRRKGRMDDWKEMFANVYTDEQKIKLLPAWIRDGLEKMDKEKQKKLDKEQKEKERRERLEANRKAEQDIINEARIAAGLPPKSKYDVS